MTALYMDESNPLSIKRVTIDHVVNNSVNKVLLTNLSCMHCILHIRRFLNSRAQMLDPSSMNGDQVHLLEITCIKFSLFVSIRSFDIKLTNI